MSLVNCINVIQQLYSDTFFHVSKSNVSIQTTNIQNYLQVIKFLYLKIIYIYIKLLIQEFIVHLLCL